MRAWVGSDGFNAVRDGAQRILIGEPKVESLWGAGMIPGDDLIDWSRAGGGVPDLLDSVVVQHWRNTANDPDRPRWEKDGVSTLGFKSYDQAGRSGRATRWISSGSTRNPRKTSTPRA